MSDLEEQFKRELEQANDQCDEQNAEIRYLKANLAACKVQRDAALAAIEDRIERIKSVIEENEKFRELLESMLGMSPYGKEWRAVCQEARDALAGLEESKP